MGTTVPYVYQEFNLRSALEVPTVRDQLRRGVKLHEFRALKKVFEDAAQKEYIRKRYGTLFQDLEFLEAAGATKMPEARIGSHIASRRHWVAVQGSFRADAGSLFDEGVQVRKIVNTLSIYAPLLILDNEAWAVYDIILRASKGRTLDLPLKYLLYTLATLQETHLPFGTVVDERYVKWLLWTKEVEEIERSLESLCGSLLKDDQEGLIPRLLAQNYCLPLHQHWISFDGWYFQPAIPSWAFSSGYHSQNYLTDWSFFAHDDA